MLDLQGIGFTKLSKRLGGGYQETGIVTRSYYEKELVLCFGSFIASRLYIKPGENNNLSRFEIEKAQEVFAFFCGNSDCCCLFVLLVVENVNLLVLLALSGPRSLHEWFWNMVGRLMTAQLYTCLRKR